MTICSFLPEVCALLLVDIAILAYFHFLVFPYPDLGPKTETKVALHKGILILLSAEITLPARPHHAIFIKLSCLRTPFFDYVF